MRQTSPIISETGFTLLELLLAVTLGGVVLSAAYSTFSTALDANRRIARVATDTQAWRFFTERFRADLKNLILGEKTLTGDRETLTLQLAPPQGDPAEVRYGRHKSIDGGQIRRRTIRGEEETESLVFDRVDTLSFRYLVEGDWKDESSERLPHAVECTVEGDGRKRSLVVALEVDDVEND